MVDLLEARELIPRPHQRLIGACVIVVLVAGFLGLFRFVRHRDAIADIGTQVGGWWGALSVVIACGLVHELVHALVLSFAGARWSTLSIRPTWKKMGLMVDTTTPLPPTALRISLTSPVVVTAVLPAMAGIVTDRGLPVLWASFCALECYADITALLATFGENR